MHWKVWRQFYNEFVSAPWGERGKVLQCYRQTTGCSLNTLMRRLKGMGFDSGRDRPPAPAPRVSDEEIEAVAAAIRSSQSKKGRMPMDTRTALLALSQRGEMDLDKASPSTMRSLLRDHKMDKRRQLAPSPHVQMRSLHPNHVHQVDASVCLQWHLKPSGIQSRDTDLAQLYKPEKIKKIKVHLLRYILEDHFSGAFFVHYYYAAGETWANMFDFLFNHAWRVKPDWVKEKYPFAHVPAKLIWDEGSANQSAVMTRILDALEVEHVAHMPGNPRAKGSVESTMWLWERKFESILRMDPPKDLEDLNQKALDFCAWFNSSEIHTRTMMPRTALWSTIRAEQIRILPALEVIQALAHSAPEKRKVEGNLTVRYRGLCYDVRHVAGIAARDRVEVMVNPYQHPDVTIAYEGRKYSAQAVQFLPALQGGFRTDSVVWGEYKSQKQTPAEKAVKKMDVRADLRVRPSSGAQSGAESGAESGAHAGAPQRILGNLHQRIPDVAYLDRTARATEIPLAAAVVPRDVPRLKAAQWIRDELGEAWRPWMAGALKDLYGDTVPEAELPAIMERLIKQEAKNENDHVTSALGNPGH